LMALGSEFTGIDERGTGGGDEWWVWSQRFCPSDMSEWEKEEIRVNLILWFERLDAAGCNFFGALSGGYDCNRLFMGGFS
jgi:hypothetical protein